MTIGGWILFIILAAVIGFIGFWLCLDLLKSIPQKVICIIVTVVLVVALFCGFRWFFQNTASGQRALTDQKSELRNGLERTITVYTADGKVLAEYSGRIDLQANSGGYVLFDYEGKRYAYYNCFIEAIAEIG